MDPQTLSIARKRRSTQDDPLTWSLQALLARHEAYVADAESRHRSDQITIESFAGRSTDLEAENARLTTENQELQSQVDTLSNALHESDNAVKSLTGTLRETQNELARMRVLAAKAERLEQQLVQVEMERQILQDTVIKSEEEERQATARWRASERALRDLEMQVETVEAEGRREQEVQQELAVRAERQRQIRETIDVNRRRNDTQKSGGHEVIASFVKEILQDNAGLQLDMAELREMLVRSQEEAEELRQQMSFTSPMPRTNPLTTSPMAFTPLDLSTELMTQAQEGARELHVHHHIHAPAVPPPSQPNPQRSARTIRARHRRHMSSRSSIFTTHSRNDSVASSAPSTIFEHASSASDAGYSTDGTSFTRPTSPEIEGVCSSPNTTLSPLAQFKPLDEVLEEACNRPRTHRRRGSNESVLSVGGMDIHATPLPSPSLKEWRRPELEGNSRPVLSKNNASALSIVSARGMKPGESAAGQALRRRLEEREQDRQKKYNPVRDTFGGWFAKSNVAKRKDDFGRRSAARVMVECVDEDGLRECLEEDEREE